jgi:hypothetical protein
VNRQASFKNFREIAGPCAPRGIPRAVCVLFKTCVGSFHELLANGPYSTGNPSGPQGTLEDTNLSRNSIFLRDRLQRGSRCSDFILLAVIVRWLYAMDPSNHLRKISMKAPAQLLWRGR